MSTIIGRWFCQSQWIVPCADISILVIHSTLYLSLMYCLGSIKVIIIDVIAIISTVQLPLSFSSVWITDSTSNRHNNFHPHKTFVRLMNKHLKLFLDNTFKWSLLRSSHSSRYPFSFSIVDVSHLSSYCRHGEVIAISPMEFVDDVSSFPRIVLS